MVRQWQEMFYEERYSEVYLSPDLPDYKMWAEAMGCVGVRVEDPEEVLPAIEKANSIDDRPVVIDFRTNSARRSSPSYHQGTSNTDIVVDPSQRPQFDASRAGDDRRHDHRAHDLFGVFTPSWCSSRTSRAS